MEDKLDLECQLQLGFKRSDQAVSLILELIAQTAARTGFQGAAALEEFFESMQEPLARLVAARAIQRIEVRLGEDMVRLNLWFDNSPTQQDETDLSLLDFLPPQAKPLEVWVFAQDLEFARFAGAADIENLATRQVPIHFTEFEQPSSDDAPAGPVAEMGDEALSFDSSHGPNGSEH